MKWSIKLLAVSIVGLFLFTSSPTPADAAVKTWDGGDGTWDNSLTNWNSGSAAWAANDDALFPNSGAAVVTIGDSLFIGSLTFNTATSGPYTFISTAGNTIDFTGAGILSSTANVQLISSDGTINFTGVGTSAGNSSISISSAGGVYFSGSSTAGSSVISSSGLVSFGASATAGSASIDNQGILEFTGMAPASAATLANGGILDISSSVADSVTVDSLTNSSAGFAGVIDVGANGLVVFNALTLPTGAGTSVLGFTLLVPGTSGTIAVPGGVFTGAGTDEVEISIDVGAPLTGIYDLIDWTGGSASGVELSDFVLFPLVPGYTLQINGSKLQLVPSTSLADDGIIWHQPLARSGMSHDTDPSAGGTLKYRFKKGSTIPIQIHVLGIMGNDVTSNSNISGTVEVFGDTNCDGAADTVALTIDYHGVGEAGGVMDKIGGHLKYNLNTKKLPTISSTNCYILQVTITDSSTGDTVIETLPLQAK